MPHQEMPLSPAETRVNNFDEVPMGYSSEQAQLEAMRCLQCKKPACAGWSHHMGNRGLEPLTPPTSKECSAN